MSSQPTEDTEEQPREIKPLTQPIPTLTSSTAQTFLHVHPLLLIAYFVSRFPSIVADPVSGLYLDLFPIAAIQCAYVTLCLRVSKRQAPTSDSTSTSPSSASKSKPQKSKGAKGSSNPNDATTATRATNALLSLLLTFFATPPTYLVLVLFGAPITTHHPHTFLAAGHFALLALFPIFYAHGVDKRTWWEVGGAMLPFDGVWGATVGTALGAWLGAIPIPLDWDREWQKWPITIVAGMYGGAVVGNIAGRTLLRGKRMDFRPPRKPKDI